MFNNTFIIGFMLLILCILGSCNTAPQDNNSKASITFFSLKGFFQQEIKQLEKTAPSVLKTVKIGDKEETRTIKIEDWGIELGSFLNADINRPSWRDSYASDSLRKEDGTLASITYTAKEDQLKTQYINIEFDQKNVSKITLKTNVSNNVYSATQSLEYIPTKGYTILQKQDVIMTEPKDFAITAQFK